MKHEIFYNEVYALIVNDEEIREGDYRLNIDRNYLLLVAFDEDPTYYNRRKDVFKKVIAHRPLKDAPILEEVALLPQFSQNKEDDVLDLGYKEYQNKIDNLEEIHSDYVLGFKEGYLKAKETYQYTLSDLKRAFNCGIDSESIDKFEQWKAFTQFIDSLQLKRPEYFECKMDTARIPYGDDGWKTIETGMKTITNSQGQTELVGTYIY